jgi:hypothetical protein
MSFYTVKMKKKRLISKFDEKGRKISDQTILIDETYHDLPYVTAMGYKEKFPEADVEIVLQPHELRRDPKIRAQGERESYTPRAERNRIGGMGTKIAHDIARKKTKTAAKAPPATRVGNEMADVINRAMERA